MSELYPPSEREKLLRFVFKDVKVVSFDRWNEMADILDNIVAFGDEDEE